MSKICTNISSAGVFYIYKTSGVLWLLQIEGAVAVENQAGVDGITSEKIQIRHQREWGYVYRPFRTEPEALSNE